MGRKVWSENCEVGVGLARCPEYEHLTQYGVSFPALVRRRAPLKDKNGIDTKLTTVLLRLRFSLSGVFG